MTTEPVVKEQHKEQRVIDDILFHVFETNYTDLVIVRCQWGYSIFEFECKYNDIDTVFPIAISCYHSGVSAAKRNIRGRLGL